jgi:hypothetical protein
MGACGGPAQLRDKDFNDLIVEVEVIPVSNEDVTQRTALKARFVSKSTPS